MYRDIPLDNSEGLYAIADLSLYEFFHSQGANITNPMELWKGGNACYLYQGTVSKDKSRNSFKDKEVVLAPHVGRVPSYMKKTYP